MSEVVLDSAHVSEGLAKLTGDNAQKNIQAILNAWLAQVQTLENQIIAVYQSRLVNNAVGAQLDLLGQLVGEPRNNRTDAAYRTGIRVRILVNFSTGTPADLVLIATTGAADATPYYVDTGYAHFQISITNLTASDDPNSLALAFQGARASGTSGDFIWSLQASNAFQWCAVGATSPLGWTDVAGSLTSGKWCGTYGI